MVGKPGGRALREGGSAATEGQVWKAGAGEKALETGEAARTRHAQ